MNRELKFAEGQRHFKPATGVLLLGMLLLGVFGIIVPLEQASRTSPDLAPGYRGVALALVAVFGYMLIDLGHYGVYQRPKYTTKSELFFLALTLVGMGSLALWWWVL